MIDSEPDSFKEKKSQRAMSREYSTDRNSLKSLRQKLIDKDLEIEVMEDKVNDIENKARRKERMMQKNINQLNEEIEELNSEIDIEKKRTNKCRIEIKELITKIEDLNIENETKQQETTMKVLKTEKLKQLKDEERLKLEEEFQKSKNILEDKINNLEKNISQLEEENNKLKDKIKVTISEKETVIGKLRRKIDESRDSIDTMKLQISSLTNKLEESKKKENEELEKNVQLNALLKNQKFTIEDHAMKIQDMEKELIELRNRKNNVLLKERKTKPVEEAITGTSLTVARKSSFTDDETTMCPNCGNQFSVLEVEQHLEICLDEY